MGDILRELTPTILPAIVDQVEPLRLQGSPARELILYQTPDEYWAKDSKVAKASIEAMVHQTVSGELSLDHLNALLYPVIHPEPDYQTASNARLCSYICEALGNAHQPQFYPLIFDVFCSAPSDVAQSTSKDYLIMLQREFPQETAAFLATNAHRLFAIINSEDSDPYQTVQAVRILMHAPESDLLQQYTETAMRQLATSSTQEKDILWEYCAAIAPSAPPHLRTIIYRVFPRLKPAPKNGRT